MDPKGQCAAFGHILFWMADRGSYAAQRAPARCGVRFVLKIAPNTALGPPTKPQCHLARCYLDAGQHCGGRCREEPAKRQRKQGTGERQVVSAAPQISSGGAWTDSGPGSWPFTYIRALPSIYIRRRQHAVCGFAALGYVQAVRRARMTDAGRPSTDTSLRSKGPGGAPLRHCRVMRPQGRAQKPTTAARALHVPRCRTKK